MKITDLPAVLKLIKAVDAALNRIAVFSPATTWYRAVEVALLMEKLRPFILERNQEADNFLVTDHFRGYLNSAMVVARFACAEEDTAIAGYRLITAVLVVAPLVSEEIADVAQLYGEDYFKTLASTNAYHYAQRLLNQGNLDGAEAVITEAIHIRHGENPEFIFPIFTQLQQAILEARNSS